MEAGGLAPTSFSQTIFQRQPGVYRYAWVSNIVYQSNSSFKQLRTKYVVCQWCLGVCMSHDVCTIDFFNSIDIFYFQRNIIGTMSSQGKERMESEAEEQMESPGDYENDDIPDLSASFPDDAQRREAWRRQELIENPFCNPSNVQNDEEDRQEAMSLQIGRASCRERV